MGIEMEGLEFQIETTAEESVKGVDALTQSLGKLKSALKGGLGLGSSVKQLERLSNALKGFQSEKIESMGNAIKGLSECKISSTIPKRISEIGSALDNIKLADIERLEDLSSALHSLSEVSGLKVPKMPKVAPSTPDEAVVGGGTTPATSDVTQVGSQMQEAAKKTNMFASALRGLDSVVGVTYGIKSVGNALSSVPAKIRQVIGNLKELVTNFKNSGGIIGAFGRSVKNGMKNTGSAIAAFVKTVTSAIGKGLSPSVRKATGRMGQFFNSIKRVAMYRAIRFMLSALVKAFKDGINNLYQYSNLMGGTFAQSMNSLATNAQYLKNSLGAMASPIINALAPAIDFVIGKIATLLNYINMLFARLSGASTFTAAKKSATSYGDALSGAGGAAADAAKEIRDATTGIDELNIIMQKDTSGGGGGGGTDYGSMFEELPIDNNVSDFADRLKQAFDNADWKTLGTLIGGKVNELIDSIDYEGIGHKLGFGINGAIQTAYYFLDTVDFHNIGAHLAELLNSALSEVDTSFIGRTIVRWFTLKWDFLIGLLGELDYGQIARKICDCVKGALDEATEWIKSYDWSAMGENLWESVKEFLTNIDWSGVATSLFTALGTALNAVGNFFGGLFGSIWDDFSTWWDEEIAGQDFSETWHNFWTAFGKGIGNIATWVWDNMISPFCSALLGEETWADVQDAGADILANIKSGWDKVASLPKNIGNFFVEVKNDAVEWWSDVKSWWGEKVGSVKKFTTDVVNNASSWWSSVKSWWSGKVGAVQNFTTSVSNHATTWWNNVKTWWSEKCGAVEKFTTNVANQATTWWNNTKTWWSGKVGAVKEFTTSVKNEASTWWSNVKSWWSGKVGAVQQFTTSVRNDSTAWWNNTKTYWSGKVGKVKEFTTSVTNQASIWWSNVKTWWSGKVGAVQQFTTSVKNEATTWWSNVKTWWSGKVGAVQQFTTSVKNEASTWWNNVKTWWSGKCGAVQQFTTSVKNEASTWWSNVKTWWSGKVGTLSVGVSIVNAASTWWSNVKTWWSNAVGTLWTTLGIKVPKVSVKWSTVTVFGKDYSYPSGFNLTWNAKGGILDGAQIFGMLGNSFLGGGEAGKEAVLPLERHTEWMDTLAEKVRNGLPEDDGTDGIGYSGFRRALEDFYTDYVQSTVNQMASDMNRQANKKEQTTVQVGNRVITDAVTTQQNANGYRFTTT